MVFSWREFQGRVNSDLIGNLGNYINRVLSFTEKYAGGEIARLEELPEDALAVLEDFKQLEARYEERMLAPRPREALVELLAMGRRANRFFDASAPWKTRKDDPEQTRVTLYTCSILLGSLAYHAAPYVPEAIERLGGFFDGPIARVSDLDGLPEGYRVMVAKPLFQADRRRRGRGGRGAALQDSQRRSGLEFHPDSPTPYALRYFVDTV